MNLKSRPLSKPELDEFRRLAESRASNRMAAAIHTLLNEVERLKAAFVPRPVPEAWTGYGPPGMVAAEPSSLVKDFHMLYRATERLVADLDAEKVTDLGDVKAQLRRLMPAFEECEVARRMGGQTKEPS